GKMILIGVYTNDILVPQIPFVLPSLSFAMFFTFDAPGTMDLKFKMQLLETGQTLFEGRAGGGFQPGTGVIPIKVGNFVLQAVGVYNFVVEVDGFREPIITQFTVQLNVPRGPQQQQPTR